ncbi:unnamed protein product [Amoebophrya sp. A120]|nr:unnamed protein product [Amoebophrya sp. A120]|eukprot:GSA120T00005268001.1
MGAKLAKGSHVAGEGEFGNQFRLGRKLGEGAFGVVHECRKRDQDDSGDPYAVKMIDRVEADTSDITREIEVMVSLDHPNIVGFVAVFQEKCFVCIVMPKFGGGDLVDGLQLHLKKYGKIPETTCGKLCAQVFSAVEHCHAKGYIHRDIKGDNVLLDRPDISDPNCKLVLSDFGTAIAHTKGKILRQLTGTRVFWSPEMCARRYSFPADAWACGVVMYGLVDATFPFRDERQICEKEPKMPPRASAECKELIQMMLSKDPERRISISNALKHDWIQKFAPGVAVQEQPAEPAAEQETASKGEVEAVGREQVPQAMALRRKEMAQVYANKNQQKKVFEVVDFKAEGLRAGEVIQYTWFEAKDAKALYEVSGTDQSGNKKAKQFVWTPKTLEAHLQKANIKTSNYGTGKAKTLGELCAEITAGECSLMHDCTGGFSSRKIVRVVELVLLRVKNGKDGQQTLIEAKEKLADGREYDTYRLPGAKQRPNENVKATAERILAERLHMEKSKVTFNYGEKEIVEVKEDSPSYPGVVTVYRKHIVEGHLQAHAMKPSDLAAVGGQKWDSFMTKGNKDEVKTWQWMTAKEITKKKIKIAGKKATDEVSSLVASNLKIDEDGLKLQLEDAKLDPKSFGANGAKTLFEVAQEVARGECHLQYNGEVLERVVEVVLLVVEDEKSGKILLETSRTDEKTGAKKAKDQLPGSKARPAESIYTTAKRITNCLLHIPEEQIQFGNHSLFEEASKADYRYPGMRTLYRKHVINCKVDAGASA